VRAAVTRRFSDHRSTAPRARAGSAVLAAAVALLVLLLAAPPVLAARHEDGTQVEVTGLVTDAAGKPLADVRVVLEASRAVFSFRSFGRELKDTRRVAAVTDGRGSYTVTWPWDDYFNHFELVAGVPVRGKDTERFEVLARSNITRRIERNNPTVATLVVENAEFVRTLQAFLASVDTDDERRIYQRMGKPDRVEDRGDERTWWYFEHGQLFRFTDGTLTETSTFDPVEKL
jgi:hypothetical protein